MSSLLKKTIIISAGVFLASVSTKGGEVDDRFLK